MSVAVLLPYRAAGCEWRQRARLRIGAHYALEHPAWPVVEGSCDGEWSKGLAVADALTRTDADTLVIADADVWVAPEALREAVAAAETHGWAIPHLKVHRLDQRSTGQFYADTWRPAYDRPPYRGVSGGGMVVLTRAAYEACPLDPRFVGWGGEDVAWGWALDRVHGPAWRGTADLWHLWHPTARVGHVGSPESKALLMRWRFATRRHGDQLAAMIDEAREALCPSL